jgi:hypothetical protein
MNINWDTNIGILLVTFSGIINVNKWWNYMDFSKLLDIQTAAELDSLNNIMPSR